MKVLVDIGHPAHVHLFKNVALEMMEKGHKFLFTCREKEFEIELLRSNGFIYQTFGKKKTGVAGKLYGLALFNLKMVNTAITFKPDLFLSHGSIYAAHASFFLRKPHIALEDTFNFEQVRLYLPFTKYVITADYKHPLSNHPKNISVNGYHETAYLHPSRFQPNPSVLKEAGLNADEPFVILRFVSWNATHDFGHSGISLNRKREAIKEFSKYARVFISSENPLPDEFQKYHLKIAPHKIHDLMSYASLLWAESFTMPAECSILGTPSIVMHNTTSYYLKEQEEKYNLCYIFSESDDDQRKAIEKGIELLKMGNLKKIWKERRDRMLTQKIDLSNFLIWFIENYPASVADTQNMNEKLLSNYS